VIKYIIILILCIISYIIGYGEAPVVEEFAIIEQNNTEYITNGTTCFKTVIDTQTKIIKRTQYVPERVLIYTNLSKGQMFKIQNLRAEHCNNIGCSEGFIQCKEQVQDIFNLKKSRFSEKPSPGFNPNFENIEVIPIKKDDLNRSYVRLNGSSWNIIKGSFNYQANITNISFNDCVYDYDFNYTYNKKINKSFQYTSLNKTYNWTTFSINNFTEVLPKCLITNVKTNILLYQV